MASRVASGMVAATVFPKRSMLIITFSGAMPKRSLAALIIRLLAWCGITTATSSPVRPFRCNRSRQDSYILRTAYLNTWLPSW